MTMLINCHHPPRHIIGTLVWVFGLQHGLEYLHKKIPVKILFDDTVVSVLRALVWHRAAAALANLLNLPVEFIKTRCMAIWKAWKLHTCLHPKCEAGEEDHTGCLLALLRGFNIQEYVVVTRAANRALYRNVRNLRLVLVSGNLENLDMQLVAAREVWARTAYQDESRLMKNKVRKCRQAATKDGLTKDGLVV